MLSSAAFARLVFAETSSAIASAKQEIVTCFEAARAAEAAGGDISGLTAVLNDAGLLLSDAESAYSRGDYDVAQNLAVQCHNSLSGFVDEAARVKATGELARSNDFLVNVVGSTVGTFAVIGAGFGVWVYLKRRHGEAEEQAVAVARV